MWSKNIKKITIIIIVIIISVMIFSIFAKKIVNKNETKQTNDNTYTTNILNNVNYVSKDAKGNEYIINAAEGEIDINDSSVIYLTDVSALIVLENSKRVTITSNYGKYNINNYDTIFNENVIINYLENKITGEYLDFSFDRNSLIISRNVIYTNEENILKADVIEMDIKTKDTKIYMYEDKKKVNIKNKN